MKWILYLGNDTHKLIEAFNDHADGKSFHGILFPESDICRFHKMSLSHQEQMYLLDSWINSYKNREISEFVFASHSEFFFLALRHAVWANKIESLEIRWLDKDHPYLVLPVDQDGRIENWPADMFASTEELLADLLSPKPKRTHQLTE